MKDHSSWNVSPILPKDPFHGINFSWSASDKRNLVGGHNQWKGHGDSLRRRFGRVYNWGHQSSFLVQQDVTREKGGCVPILAHSEKNQVKLEFRDSLFFQMDTQSNNQTNKQHAIHANLCVFRRALLQRQGWVDCIHLSTKPSMKCGKIACFTDETCLGGTRAKRAAHAKKLESA